ncbi:MAG: AAA family ATPase [Gemmatimonadales bacterium]|nr:AAA family ATPase [Gemmatimonadales bacterium]
MKLRRLELSGFKSFADPTELLIEDGVTSIIGPNGCGKSNISDAVRWVLGEHNPRVLRGARMDEVIFQGSAGRRAQNVAEVGLCFDNSDRTLDLDFAEVVIARRVSRSGESEYLINNAPVTRRELLAKLAGTGLGTDQSVVIESRMVDALLSDRPDDRRALFEEAAGLGLYRDRKRSTERRLEETTTDLVQVENLISEVQTRVRSLSRQRKKSERYTEMVARRYQLVAALARHDVSAIDAAMRGLDERRQVLATLIPAARAALTERERERQSGLEARAGAEAQRAEVERRVGEARLAANTLEGDLALSAERSQNASARKERALSERAEAQAAAVRLEREREAAAAERGSAEHDRSAVQMELGLRVQAEDVTRAALAVKRVELRGLEEALQKQAEEVRRHGGERQALERELADLREELSAAEARRAGLIRDRETAAAQEAEVGGRHGSLAERLVSLALEADRSRHALAEAREHEARLRADRRATEESLAQSEARRDALAQLERDHVGLAPAAAALLETRDRFEAGAVLGPLSDFVRARREDAAEAEHVLGEWLHAVVVADLRVCDAIHAWHRESAPGPLLLLPLDPGPVGGGERGELAQRVAGDGAAARWVERLLAGARPFAPAGEAIIRANGAVYLPGPSSAGGPLRRRAELEALSDDASRLAGDLEEQDRAQAAAAAQLARAEREAADAEVSVEATRGLERHAAAESDDARRHVAHVERDLAVDEGLVARLTERTAAVEQRLSGVNTALSTGELERIRLEARLEDARARLTELEDEQEAARERRVHWQVEDAQVGARFTAVREREERASAALLEFTARIDALAEEVGGLSVELAALEGRRNLWRDELGERRAALAELERAAVTATDGVAGAEQALTDSETRLAEARDGLTAHTEEGHRTDLDASELSGSRRVMGERLAAEWGKSLDEILAEPAAAEGAPDVLRAEGDELRQAIESLGPINALAVEEHDDESKRLNHLVTQRDDIIAAKSSLQQSVRELDVVARERFLTTFDAARANFQRVFETLFGGGSCDVFLVDPNDPLDSEIEIHAKPRGKRTERIHLLSAGERSLVALSLLFGIYLSKPSPFCVLDEVDAPLDDANIGRFTRLLDEFKANTQFIVITHNPRTMAVADAVYGVTMQEPGVSNVVSVRLGDTETQAA